MNSQDDSLKLGEPEDLRIVHRYGSQSVDLQAIWRVFADEGSDEEDDEESDET